MKPEIFNSIYRLKIPDKVWKREKDSLFEDYKQEMYLLLLELPDEKVEDLLSRGKLVNYFTTICKNQTRDENTFMTKMFGKLDTVEYDDLLEVEDDTTDRE